MDNEKPKTNRPFFSVKSDIVFKLFFADERNEEELIALLKSVLRLPEDEYESIEIADPHLLPDYTDDKYAIIDVKLHTKTRKVIHIEVQLKVPSSMKNRIVFYDAKLITEQIGSGGEYDDIQKVISIIITDEDLISNSNRYHHRFTFFDPDAEVEFTDIIEIYTIELRKLPADTDGTTLYDWAKFIDAETEEELNMIVQRNPQVRKAAVKLVELSADERARDLIERREKGRRDAVAFANDARAEGIEQGLAKGLAEGRIEGLAEGRTEGVVSVARNALKRGMSIDEVIGITDLTREEVEALSKPE